MASSTIRSIALVVSILAPISVFSQTFPSLAAVADKQQLKPAATRSTRRPDRALSRYASFRSLDGLNLSARGGAGRALAERK